MRAQSCTSVRLPGFARRTATLTLALLISGVGSALAQYPNPGTPIHEGAQTPGISSGRPRFSADATLQPSDGGMEVRVDYRLERDELLFERTGTGYHGAYEVRVIFYRTKGGAQVTGDVFQRTLRVPSYSDTRLRGADIIDNVSLRVPAGKYRVQVVVTDLVAECASGTDLSIEVPTANDQSLWFSDLSLGTATDPAEGAPARGRFVPVPSRRFGLDLPSMAILAEIVDHRTGPEGGVAEQYRIDMKVLNDLRETVWQGDTTVTRQGGRTPLLIRPRLQPLEAGSYRIILELMNPAIAASGRKKPTPIRRERAFTVEQTSENVAWDSRASLEVLDYIADPSEKEEMERLASPEDRRSFWERFWRRRDPTPESDRNEAQEEFYRRVQYSNQHFGTAGPGWKTDMGRIYIQNGAPDEVIRNPFNFDRPPEEVWYYYKDRLAYVFVDKDGFGRYELAQIRRS